MLTASITFELIFLEVLLWHGQGRRATLRLGGGGVLISDSILKGRRHFFLLTLYRFEIIGAARALHLVPLRGS